MLVLISSALSFRFPPHKRGQLESVNSIMESVNSIMESLNSIMESVNSIMESLGSLWKSFYWRQ